MIRNMFLATGIILVYFIRVVRCTTVEYPDSQAVAAHSNFTLRCFDQVPGETIWQENITSGTFRTIAMDGVVETTHPWRDKIQMSGTSVLTVIDITQDFGGRYLCKKGTSVQRAADVFVIESSCGYIDKVGNYVSKDHSGQLGLRCMAQYSPIYEPTYVPQLKIDYNGSDVDLIDKKIFAYNNLGRNEAEARLPEQQRLTEQTDLICRINFRIPTNFYKIPDPPPGVTLDADVIDLPEQTCTPDSKNVVTPTTVDPISPDGPSTEPLTSRPTSITTASEVSPVISTSKSTSITVSVTVPPSVSSTQASSPTTTITPKPQREDQGASVPKYLVGLVSVLAVLAVTMVIIVAVRIRQNRMISAQAPAPPPVGGAYRPPAPQPAPQNPPPVLLQDRITLYGSGGEQIICDTRNREPIDEDYPLYFRVPYMLSGSWQYGLLKLDPGPGNVQKESFDNEMKVALEVVQRGREHYIAIVGARDNPSGMLYELSTIGTLRDFLYSNNPDSRTKLHFAHNICDALDFLSKNRIILRNLSLKRIWVYNENRRFVPEVKITNLKAARQEHIYTSHTALPPDVARWLAPESTEHSFIHSEKSDVWMFGVVMLQMFIPELSNLRGDDLSESFDIDNFGTDCPQAMNNLIRNCWYHDQERRPKFEVLLPWIAQMLTEADA